MFGPILHVIRYKTDDIDRVEQEINGSGYGLTLGIHSRIDGFAEKLSQEIAVGNAYINRSMIGAVVGTQPFADAACPEPVQKRVGRIICPALPMKR